MDNNKLQTLKDMLGLLNKQTISPEQLAQFLKAVTDSIQKTKASLAEENTQNTQELKSRLEQSLTELEEGQKQLKTALEGVVNGKIKELDVKIKDTLEKAIKRAEQAILKVESIHVEDGVDGLDGTNGVDGKDGSPDTRKEIVEKINTGKKKDSKIQAEQIEGIDKFTTQENLDRAIAILDQRSQFLINKTVKVDGVTITGSGTDSNPLVAVGGGGGGGTWGSITGTLSSQTDLQTALDTKVDENPAITGATKTKITYDTKGLVTAGADATTADIADSANKRYVTDANLTVIGNTSGTNTGDNAVNSSSATAAQGVTADNALPKAGGTMTGGIVLVAGTTTIQPIKMVAGVNLTTPVAGVFEFDGTNLYFSV